MNSRLERRRGEDRRRREQNPARSWYGSKAWKLRRAQQLARVPWCEPCKRAGRHRAASIADHIEPHRGDRQKFFHGTLQSSCKECHDSAKQKEELDGFSRTIGADGWPTDPRHPFNAPRRSR